MKTKILIVTALLSAGLLTGTSTFARGPGGGGPGGRAGGNRNGGAACDLSGPGQGTPQRDGSGRSINNRGNPKFNGTPVRDGSGKATAPGQGPKDGTGNAPRHPAG
jgi:hypothetical protein